MGPLVGCVRPHAERRVRIEPCRRYLLTLPYSEVCMHMQVPGKVMEAQLTGRGSGVQLFRDGRPWSGSITHGEAGIYTDVEGLYSYLPDWSELPPNPDVRLVEMLRDLYRVHLGVGAPLDLTEIGNHVLRNAAGHKNPGWSLEDIRVVRIGRDQASLVGVVDGQEIGTTVFPEDVGWLLRGNFA